MSTEVAAPPRPAEAVETPTLDLIIEGLAWLVLGLVPLLINVYNVDAYRTIQATYSTIFISLIAGAWAISVTLTGRWGEVRKLPLLLPLAGFSLWSLLTWVFTSPSKPVSAESWVNLLLYCGFFFVLSDLGARKPSVLWRLCAAIFVAFSFNVVTGILQHKGFAFLTMGAGEYGGLYGAWPIKTAGFANYFAGLQAPSRLLSAAGTLGNQNVLGGYLAATIPLFVALPVILAISWTKLSDMLLKRYKTMQESTARLILGAAMTILAANALASLACLLATDTRGAWLGVLASFVLGVLVIPAFFKDQLSRISRQAWSRIIIGGAVGIVVLGSMAYAAGITPKMLVNKVEDTWTVQQRLVAWEVAGYMVEKHPILGRGLGTYKIYYFKDLAHLFDGQPHFFGLFKPATQVPIYMHNRYVQAHNDFIQQAAEEGWPGLAFGVAILLAFWIAIPRYIWRARPSVPEGLLMMASLLGTFGLCVFGLTNFPFHIASSSTAWTALAAFSGASLWRERRLALAATTTPGPQMPLEAKWALSGALAVLAGALIVFTYLPYKADMYTKEGMELYKSGQIVQAGNALKRAIMLDPERGDARLVLGIVYAMMNDFKDAEYQFIRCQTSYDDVTLHYYLGRVYEAEKKWPEAYREYQIAQSYFPASTDIGRVVAQRVVALQATMSALAGKSPGATTMPSASVAASAAAPAPQAAPASSP